MGRGSTEPSHPGERDLRMQAPDGPVLIIGQSGQLATDLVRVASEEDKDAVALGRPQCDLTDSASLLRLLDRVMPCAVINAAAYTQVDQAESEPELAMQVNALGPEMLAQICARQRIPLIHVSTDQVFDGKKQGAYTEQDEPNPLCVYGRTKREGEQRVLNINPHALIVRVSWVYGPSGSNFVTKVLEWARMKSPLSIVSDQFGCPTYAPDLALHLLNLSEKMARTPSYASGLLHLAGASAMSRYEQARLILASAHARGGAFADVVPVLTKDFPTPAIRPLNAELDCAKAARLYDIYPVDFETGLHHTLDLLYSGR
jgi:dTDP-4-dehydrorhamnose reductase